MTVLIVEDDAELRRALWSAFRLAGWVTYKAPDLHEARMILDLGAEPDVILTDRRLHAEDGASLIVPGGPPVVIFSGDDAPVPGAATVIVKPMRLAEVVRRVAEVADPEFEGAVVAW